MKINKPFICILFIITFFVYGCDKIGAGSYADAETYKVNASMQKLINAVNTFKIEHPEMAPSDSSGLKDYSSDPFYMAFFYYRDKKVYTTTYIRSNGDNSSYWGLVAIRAEGSTSARIVNNDIKGSENEAVKQEFVARILNPIKEILNRK